MSSSESLYLKTLLDEYCDHLGKPVSAREESAPYPILEGHYKRQQLVIYSVESLRNFARHHTPQEARRVGICDAEAPE